jgi:hypothetical protein
MREHGIVVPASELKLANAPARNDEGRPQFIVGAKKVVNARHTECRRSRILAISDLRLLTGEGLGRPWRGSARLPLTSSGNAERLFSDERSLFSGWRAFDATHLTACKSTASRWYSRKRRWPDENAPTLTALVGTPMRSSEGWCATGDTISAPSP